MLRTVWISILILLTTSGIFAQGDSSKSVLGIIPRLHYGFLIPHRVGLDNLITGHTKMIEISIDKQTCGEKEWERTYAHPSYGASFFFIDMANPDQLGYGFGLLPYVNYPILSKEKFRFNIRVGVGAIYGTKPFRQGVNKNIIYGSNINALVNFTGEGKIKINERLNIHPGIAFTHFSNGAWELPNLGINAATVSLGTSYYFNNCNSTHFKQNQKDTSSFKPYFELTLSGAVGSKKVEVNGNRFFVGTGNLEFAARISPMSQFSIGIDEFYNTSVQSRMEDVLETELTRSVIPQTGIVLGYGLKMEKLYIGFGWGTYVYTYELIDTRFYHKLCTNYYLTDKLIAKFTLKSHFAKADFFELGLGYRLWKSK